MEVEIREIVEDDLSGFHEWYGPQRDASFRESLERHQAGKLVYLVALVGGRPIGHLGVILDPEERSRMGPGELWQLGVHPVLQGHGIGTRLIETGEHILRGHGIRSASIGVAYDNPSAKRLYERLGYEVVGESVDRWSYTDTDGEEVQVVEDGWDLQKEL